MTTWRTEFSAFVLDLLDFLEEKIAEALETEPSRVAAIGEAAGAIPLLRERLRENDVVNAYFILALGNMFEGRWASEWWDDFAKMDRAEFEETARDLIGPQGRLAILRRTVAEAGHGLADGLRYSALRSSGTSPNLRNDLRVAEVARGGISAARLKASSETGSYPGPAAGPARTREIVESISYNQAHCLRGVFDSRRFFQRESSTK